MKFLLLFKHDCEIKTPVGHVLTFKRDQLEELDSDQFEGEEGLRKVITELISAGAAVPGGPQTGPVVRGIDYAPRR